MSDPILLQLANCLSKALNAKAKNKKELFEKQIVPMHDAISMHNTFFLRTALELRCSLNNISKRSREKPNDITDLSHLLDSQIKKLEVSLSEGRTHRTQIQNTAIEFAVFPFYSRPILGWLTDQERQDMLDYFDSIVRYFDYNQHSEHALRHFLNRLKGGSHCLKKKNELSSIIALIEELLKEIAIAEKFLVDRWAIISRKRASLEGSILHG